MIIIVSCTNNTSELKYDWHIESNDPWYETTRKKIIEQSKLKADHTSDVNVPGVEFLVRKYYNGRHEFRREYLDNSEKIRGIILFSRNGDFELRNEIFENGTLSFEGIVYKGKFSGLSRWWHPNGKIREVGRRFNGRSFGVWETYDEDENLIKAVDDGKTIPNDSLPSI